MDVGGAVGQAELGQLLIEHGREGGVCVILRLGLQRPCRDLGNGLAQNAGTGSRHPVEQLTAGLFGVDGHLLADEDIAGVQPFVHLHDGDAGLGIAVQHGPLHRGAAAVLGQQRDVQVDAAVLGRFQHRSRQDAAIGHHHDQFRRKGLNVGVLAAVPQGAGLEDRGAVLQGHFLDRRRGEHLLAAHRLIPAGIHAADLMPGGIEGFQALGCDIRGPHEQNAHYLFPFASRAAFLPSSVSS